MNCLIMVMLERKEREVSDSDPEQEFTVQTTILSLLMISCFIYLEHHTRSRNITLSHTVLIKSFYTILYYLSTLHKPCIVGCVIGVINRWCRDVGIRDFSGFHSKTFHTHRTRQWSETYLSKWNSHMQHIKIVYSRSYLDSVEKVTPNNLNCFKQ